MTPSLTLKDESTMTHQTVQKWMTSNPITIHSQSTLPQARKLMEERHIRRLPVVDDDELVEAGGAGQQSARATLPAAGEPPGAGAGVVLLDQDQRVIGAEVLVEVGDGEVAKVCRSVEEDPD
ncbi:MAG: CBS domain-containing protein [Anaerolineae bacterium]|nr:CBS domain-containing protein [Anaerolineae bacterium]